MTMTVYREIKRNLDIDTQVVVIVVNRLFKVQKAMSHYNAMGN